MEKSVLRRILQYTKPYRLYLIFALISAIISVSLTLYAPVLIGDGIDLIVGKNDVDFKNLFVILTILGGTILLSALFQWLMSLCMNTITHRTIRDIRISIFNKISDMPLKYIDANSHGDLMSRVGNDVDQISDGLLQGFSQLFTGIITIIGTLAFMLSINVTIAVVVVLMTPISLFVASYIAKKSHSMFREQSATRGEMSGLVEEMIGNQKIVKAFSYENRAQDRFEEINSRLYDCGVKAQFYSAMTNPSTRFVNGLVYAAVGVIGAINAINGGISIGQISCFLSYANQYTKPFNEISGVVNELQNAFASAKRVFEIMDKESEKPDIADAVEVKETDGKIEIKHVYFSYNKKSPLIEDFNLDINPGQRIAIVGPTGCGKTTMINLLMRFYDIDSGSIKVSNVEIQNMARNNLRSLYGMVLQESWLFSGTVKQNIAYGKIDATDEEIIEAAKSAHAHSFIKRLPQGYDTVISDEADNISQGQKQLLCIARVLLTRPPMLILDEATSNIDTRTEIKIQKVFGEMMKGRTSFIVAHRLSTIKEADSIIVMNKGHIIEQGNHQELIQKKGFYANLYNSQFELED
ncbi:MAG: transporter ATP-binding protein [Oscillospiraceae bacterium]|nr:transporter ATP-binding protein [Oscillospiraceae bacterium]